MFSLDDIEYRENAIVLYNDKIYADVNHQYAFELALNDEGRTMGLDIGNGDISKAEKIVDKAHSDGKITTWHWFSKEEENYLICNFENDFFKNYKSKTIQSYACEHQLKLGYLNGINIVLLD